MCSRFSSFAIRRSLFARAFANGEQRKADSVFSFLLFFRRHRQTKDRKLPDTTNVHATRFCRIRQVERLAEFAAIHFRVDSPCLLGTAAFLFEHVGGVIPALQVPATELSLFVFFVAGTLAQLL